MNKARFPAAHINLLEQGARRPSMDNLAHRGSSGSASPFAPHAALAKFVVGGNEASLIVRVTPPLAWCSPIKYMKIRPFTSANEVTVERGLVASSESG